MLQFNRELNPQEIELYKFPVGKDYIDWYNKAKTGETFVYFKGLSPAQSITTKKLAKFVMYQAEQGLIYLFRKKHGEDDFDFIAKKTKGSAPRHLVPRPTSPDRMGKQYG